MRNLKIAIEVFSVLGKTPKNFTNRNFKFYLVHNWQIPSLSPIILLPGKSIDSSDLKSIKTYFQKYPIKNSALKNVPYFNFFKGRGLYDIESIESICEENKWVIDPDPITINLMQKPIPMNLPPGFHIVVHNSSNPGIADDYKDILRINFNADEKYIEYVDSVYRQTKAHSYTVLIRCNDGHSVGGGTVSIRNRFAFFTWGAINEHYRNRGFHEMLLAACKMIATSYGVEACALTTRNKYIKRKSDSFIEMYICRSS